jgi:hypothetical protein
VPCAAGEFCGASSVDLLGAVTQLLPVPLGGMSVTRAQMQGRGYVPVVLASRYSENYKLNFIYSF